MSHQFKASELRRFYRSINSVFTRFESSEETETGFTLTYPATGQWRRNLEGFPQDFMERFPAFDVSVEGVQNGRLRLHLRGAQESRKVIENMISFAKSGSLELPSRLGLAFRRATAPLRLSPSFLVIGAPRSGTTSLYSYLCQHPRMLRPATKELGFFDIFFGRGLSYYRSMFPSSFRKVGDGSGARAVTGEATPTYLANHAVPGRVRGAYPDVKLIAMIRNPVDRAFSQYQWGVRNGFENLSFEEAVDSEEQRLAGEVERMAADVDYFSAGWTYHSYLSTGRYAEHLERWTESFPRKQLMVLSIEAFAADPSGEFQRVLEFLELPAFEPEEFKKFNASPPADLMPDTRTRLELYFRPHNERLWDFLGTDLGWNQAGTATATEGGR